MTDLELQLLQRNTMALEAIRDILCNIRADIQFLKQLVWKDTAPDFQSDLSAYPNFNWDTIGAVVTQSDRYGAAVVTWGGHTYIRRAPQNKFGEAIWFSRCTGKGNSGENIYSRLITFKRRDTSVEPIPERVSKHLHLTS